MTDSVAENVLSREEEYALIDRAVAGDHEAFGQLVRTYQVRVYSTIFHMVGNHEDADDITQDTFIKAYKALKSFKKNSGFFTWLYRIAVNLTINFLNSRKKRRFISFDHADYDAESDAEIFQLISDKTPRKNVDIHELREKLNEAIQQLSEKHRAVVVMHDIQGMSHEEISEILKCSNGTVRSRLFYARQQLQAALNDYLQNEQQA
jgi:RNA polymerase sigma-70 factor (ECF subfamily)